MASKTVQAAIKGSIANPEAAKAVLEAIDASGDTSQLEADVQELQGDVADLESDKLTASPAASQAAIPTPASATAEECANKINDVIAALKAAGVMSA